MTAIERWCRIFPGYQLRWMFEPSRFAIGNKARQIGFSFATAAACVLNGLIYQRTQLVISASQKLSFGVLAKARAHCEFLAALGFKAANKFSTNNSTAIAWRTGGRIEALPANDRTARSFSGDVWLDEAAYFLDLEGIRDAVFPMVTRTGSRLRVLSTPNGTQGLFYDWVTNPLRGWKVHRVTIDDAIADGFKVDRDELFHSVAGSDERLFNQWFHCQFLDADLQYFPTAMVEAARKWTARPDLGGAEYFAGLDVGREHDLTALTVVALLDGVAWVVKTITCKRTNFAEQKKLIRDARRWFKWQKFHIDETGIGRQLAEELVEEFGSEAVPLTFTNPVKADLATRTLRWFRDERVRLPVGNEGTKLAAEMVACRRTITNAGNVVFDVPRSGAGHGDRFWSMCLALWGADEPVAPRGLGRAPLLAIA